MSGVLASRNAFALCSCGHPWISHDIEEYDGDGSDMCCVEGCSQQGCPGRQPLDAVEQACMQFAPVHDQINEHGRKCFTAFHDIGRAHVTVSLSSAATRECVRVFIEPAEDDRTPRPTPSGIVHPALKPTALHLCRCMASELRDALNRAFAAGGFHTLEEKGTCQHGMG